MIRRTWLVACSSVAGLVLAAAVSLAHEVREHDILILQSLDTQTSPYDVPTLEFRQRLQGYLDAPISIVEISLDARWGDRAEREPYQLELLRNRFMSQPPDLVVGMGPSAIDFWLRYRDEFPSPVPSLLVAREGMVTPEMLRPGDAGIVSNFSFTQVMEQISAVLPETRRVVVVFGASELERDLTAAARGELAAFEDRVEFTYTSDLDIPEMEDLLSRLPDQSAVLFGILTIDAGGLILPFDAGLKRVVAASNAPVFGVFDHELGDGIVGGRLISTRRMAIEMAVAARRILEDPVAEPVLRVVPLGGPIYDWRAIDAWNIDTSRLPPGSEILFRPPTLWSEYGLWTVLAGAVVAGQGMLIAALLIARRRRRAAELSSLHLSSRLISAHEDERSRLARELHDDMSQRLAGLAIDAGFLQRGPEAKGYSNALDNLQQELTRISKDVHDMSYRLHPTMVGDLGVVTALRTEVDRIRRQSGCRIEARIEDIDSRPPQDVSLCLYRIAQQALANAVKYSEASVINVSFEREGDSLVLEVRDDGKGFDMRDLEFATGIGISSMRERARLAGGTLELHSGPRQGTRVTVRVPIAGAAA